MGRGESFLSCNKTPQNDISKHKEGCSVEQAAMIRFQISLLKIARQTELCIFSTVHMKVLIFADICCRPQ